MFKHVHSPFHTLAPFKPYFMHFFGFVAFLFTFSLGIMALVKQTDVNNENLAMYLPYGILIFFINLFYLKAMRLSRESYEGALQKEKEYSQTLLHSQKKFLRYAVHETNTPLAVIMANIELYELEHGKDETLLNIEAATKNIYGIYDDLSYLTKKDKIDYHKQNLIFVDFIKSRIEFFNVVAKQSGLTFECINHCGNSMVYLNETKLQRIIDNNITNAIKYTKENHTIKVSLYEHENTCIFEISSTSTLIKNTKHIFDAYRRENHVKDGLGLGLNLVKTICDEEDIKIELYSSEDNTSFKYYFQKVTQ